MREKVNYSYEKAQNIISALDLSVRILLGQYDEIPFYLGYGICYSQRDPELLSNFVELRHKLIPFLKTNSMNASLGIWGEDTPERAIKAYDIQQALRYQLAWYNHKEGAPTYTVNFRVPFFHGEWNMEKKDQEYIYRVLERYGYPDYKKWYVRFNPWACPMVISDYAKENLCMEIFDTKIIEIINDSLRFKKLLLEWDITGAFGVYYRGNEYQKCTQEIARILQTNAEKTFQGI